MFVALLFLTLSANVFAQKGQHKLKAPSNWEGVATLGKMPAHIFPGYEGAPLIANLYISEGVSYSDRFSYEVVVLDSLLVTNFQAHGSDDFHHVGYLRKRFLTSDERHEILSIIKKAKLKQVLKGMPSPLFSGYGQRVLIVQTPSTKIAGGTVYSFWDGEDADSLSVETTLGGNVKLVADYLLKLFPMFDTLRSIAAVGHSLPEFIASKSFASYLIDPAVPKSLPDLLARQLDSNGNTDRSEISDGDSTVVIEAASRMLGSDSSHRQFYFTVLTFELEEGLDALTDTIPIMLDQFIRNHPRDFLAYFSSDPSLQFGQLDDWASIISGRLQGNSSAEYDKNELELEQFLRPFPAATAQQQTLDVFLDRVRDMKHNREERMAK